ncbi:uncharacterized protein LOC125185281 [Salvia hispanica]|uniref:uncharacterized protein LOC125185281 n=1 Tax=Salvia hispanica TaxID=49212 RepID=UPI002009A349|nr:uncharacterized protein LOC125185281 [Salvia hispanica]
MEKESFVHMCHEHPLSLIVPDSTHEISYIPVCYGCWRYILPGDAMYGCSRGCGFRWMLHKECMEMPQEIMHPVHPSHPLTLHDSQLSIICEPKECAVCELYMYGLSYGCSQGDCDGFMIHLRCAVGFSFKEDEHRPIEHPSHPKHKLHFLKKTRGCPFPCDACGANEKGDSYICTLCNYWIHERCALLPLSADFYCHDHPLSLAFYPPLEYIRYQFDCDRCSTTLSLTRWVYHCQLCRYVVHLKCATSTFDSKNDHDNENANAIDDDDEKEATKFPVAVEDMYEKMIRPFVKQQLDIIPHHDHDNHNIGGKYRFFGHPDHQLTFTIFSSASSSSHNHCQKDDDDDDDENDFDNWGLICDGCALPIREKKQTGDEYKYENGYMTCDECKYFLHLSCFNLPHEIPNLPIHPLNNHKLTLRNVDGKLTGWIECYICRSYTNRLYYACTYNRCFFKIDIKCASLPNTIKHASHLHHNHLKLVKDDDYRPGFCVNCQWPISERKEQYKCNTCRFYVCGECVMLPTRNKHRLENHLLWLTYDARVNRPGDFYCSNCEGPMDPRSWMYYCRDCDQSFHPRCFPATSGDYRNIKYGAEQYVISSIHDHPLRFQIITNKNRCGLCHGDYYDKPGFQCALCFFVICKSCGIKHMDDA